MTVWEILQISATKDKKAIKRAYARQTRICHPEEEPEAFKRIYQAYQEALSYAEQTDDDISPVLTGAEPNPAWSNHEPERVPEEPRPEPKHPELEQAFRTAGQWREEFRVAWKRCMLRRHEPEEYQRWLEYLKSEAFQSIQMDPWVLSSIVSELQQEYHAEGRLYQDLWQQYGFQRSEQEFYKAEQEKLYECLLRKLDALEAETARLKKKQTAVKRRTVKKMGCMVSLVIMLAWGVIGNIALTHQKNTQIRNYLKQYLQQEYPDTVFQITQEEASADLRTRIFYLRTELCPEIMAVVSEYKSSEDRYWVYEDYRYQNACIYAQHLGLKCQVQKNGYWKNEIVFYYRDMADVDAFLEQFQQLTGSRDFETYFSGLDLLFCPESVYFPEFILNDREGLVSLGEDISAEACLERKALKQKLVNAYLDYMYHYESWNVTAELLAMLGREEEIPMVPENFQAKPPRGFASMDATEHLAYVNSKTGLQIKAYDRIDYGGYSRYISIGRYITIGNLYQYLRACQVEIRIEPDGSGFCVEDGPVFGIGGEYQGIPLAEAYELVKASQGD